MQESAPNELTGTGMTSVMPCTEIFRLRLRFAQDDNCMIGSRVLAKRDKPAGLPAGRQVCPG